MSPTMPGLPPPKPRPGVWWFGVGALLVIAGGVVAVVLVFGLFDGFFSVEARMPADGEAHQVSVGTDGDRFLWVQEADDADCTIRDTVRDVTVSVSPVSGEFTRTGNGGSWRADGRFDAGSGRLSVTCASSGGPVEIGPAVVVRDFVRSLLVAILLPLALGGAGLMILIGTGILWATRPRREA